MRFEAPGGFEFLDGGEPYSAGVVAGSGFEIVHATLADPRPWRSAFGAIMEFLAQRSRPATALCGLELRSPAAASFAGFAQFNAEYRALLGETGLLVDGRNPVARTNVVPVPEAPATAMIRGFSFTIESDTGSPTFVTAGAGELIEDELDQGAIVAHGDTSTEGLRSKAEHVVRTMTKRLRGLGVDWSSVTTIDVYTIHGPGDLIWKAVQPAVATAAAHGYHWYPSQPPVTGLEFEMDVRGVRRELVVDL